MSGLRERIETLSPEKRRLLENRLRQHALEPHGESAIPKTADGPRRLSTGQERLWFVDQIDPNSAAYNLAWALRLKGPLNVGALKQALDALVVRQDAFRTTFQEVEGLPFQFVNAPRPVEMRLLNRRDNPSDDNLEQLLSQEAQRPFNLKSDLLIRAMLVQLRADKHVLLLTVHHICSDGWSRGILHRELSSLYAAFVEGRTPSLPELPISYADFAEWQRQWLDKGLLGDQLEYWKKQLAGAPAILNIPTDHPRPSTQSYRGAKETLSIPGDVLTKLEALGRQENVTLFMILLAAFQSLLHLYTGDIDILVGAPVANRKRVETENLIGFFLNMVVLRADFSGEPTFRQLLSRVREVTLGAFANQEVPFGKLVESLRPQRVKGYSPLFQVMLTVMNSSSDAFAAAGLTSEVFEVETGATPLEIVLGIVRRPNELFLRLVYSTDLFEAATMRRFAGYYARMLEAIVADPDQSLSALPIFTERERRQVLVEWNNTAAEFPGKDLGLHQLIEQQAARTPDQVALVFQQETLTYSELDRRANQVAHHLTELGVGPDVLVGLCVERSLEMAVAILGILKAGGAYVPLDPNFPPLRLSYMVEDSQIKVLLTHRGLEGKLEVRPQSVVRLDSDWDTIAKRSGESTGLPSAKSHHRAYVLYTSGSTGKPKGVEIPHSAIVNLLLSMQRQPGFSANDTLLAVTSLSFDISGLELYLPLITGGKVVIASYEDALDPLRLVERMRESECTVMQATPATWRALIQSGWSGSPKLKILCGGEALLRDLADDLLPRCAELWNMYGPTETTVWSAVHRVTPGTGPVPVGKAMANTQLYVLNAHRNLIPTGAIGELYIGGDGLARGYLNREELTREKFVSSPFVPGARLYRTGDLARWSPDGNIECLGRVDTQAKVRGFRIELGEIESVLALHPAIRQCVALARQDRSGEKQLAAYFEAEQGMVPSAGDLRAYLEKKLPGYMIPAVFVPMEKLPLTPNGKIDRKSLLVLDESGSVLSPADISIAPRTELEIQIAAIWEDVLGVHRTGVDDNFFDLGGDSLKVVQICFRARRQFGKELPPSFFYQNPTIRRIASFLAEPHKNARGDWATWQHYRNGDSRPTLIGLHGVDDIFVPLAQRVADEFSFHTLTCRVGFDGGVPPYYPCQTVEEMAQGYLEQLRSFKPKGPYFLIGFCLGGLIAYEVARRLTEEGEEVPFLGLFNSVPSALPIINGSFGRRVKYRFDELAQLDFADKMHYMGARLTETRNLYTDRVRRTAAKIKRIIRPPDENISTRDDVSLTPEILVKQIAAFGMSMHLKYLPLPYKGKVWLFHHSHLGPAFRNRWARLALGGIESHLLPGKHLTMMEDPYILETAAKLNASLRKSLPLPLEEIESSLETVTGFGQTLR